MFLIFTPYTFLFVSLYVILLFFMFNISNFHMFWLFMEMSMLLFMGICYTLFTNSYTQLMIYFLFQTLGSFSILVFFMLNYSWLAVFSVFLKLGMFPFFSWYLNAMFRFPSFVVFLATTIHKLPPLFIFFTLANSNLLQFTFFFALFTIVIAGVFMMTVVDLRYLVIVSSMGNNSFLLLAVLTNSISTFLVFFIIYSINMFLILSLFNNQTTVIYSIQLSKLSVMWLMTLLFNMAAMPPLPGFFTKFLIFFDLLPMMESYLFFFVLVMLVNILMMVSYIQLFFKLMVNNYSNSCNFILN